MQFVKIKMIQLGFFQDTPSQLDKMFESSFRIAMMEFNVDNSGQEVSIESELLMLQNFLS